MFLHTDFIKALVISIALGMTFVMAAAQVYASEEETDDQTVAGELEKTEQEVAAKEKEIADIEAKIRSLQSKHSGAASEAAIIADQVNKLQQQLNKAQLELRRTQLNIKAIESEKTSLEKEIEELQESIEHSKQKLRALVRLLYEKDQESIFKMFFGSWSLSMVLAEQNAYKELQDRTIEVIRSMQQDEENLKKKQEELESREEGLSKLKLLLDRQQQDLASKNQEQKRFLAAKKEEQVTYENLIADARQARDEIKQSIFTLKNSNIEMSLTDAVSIAKYASSITGVRPALLLGVLKVESNMGNNLGSGRYPNDMQPASRAAFLRITAKLGLDPYTTPVSAKPNYGWGGAMGPAQIMPATWEGIEGRVANLMGKPLANPYEMTDAIVAMAIFLADRGASNPDREYEAVNRYFAGNNWQRFTWYGDRVMAVAREYEGSI